jgi:hypothetical protein
MKIGYIIILLISIIFSILSIIIEYYYPIIGNNISNDLARTIIYRITHFSIFFYCSLYLIFFKPSGFDSYIYLIFNLILNLQWCICNCCILSYYELLNYDYDYNLFSTKFHPYIFSVTRNWSESIMDIVGVLILTNIFVILYSNKSILLRTKILYITIFVYSIYICATGKNPILNYIKNIKNNENEKMLDKVLIMKEEIKRVDNLNMYPTDADSFFMKYIK